MRIRRYLLVVAVALGLAAPSWSQENRVIAAMQDELQRSMATLRIAGQPAPYYIAYQLDDMAGRRVTGRLGEISEDVSGHSRTLRVEVRVGNYDFDSSQFVGASSSAADAIAAPLDDDYDVIRRQAWLLTDAAYKRAV